MQCEAVKRNGEQCGAHAVAEQTKCAGHLGLGAMKDPRRSGQVGAARTTEIRRAHAEERKRTLLDRLAVRLEAEAGHIERVFAQASRANLPVTTVTRKDGSTLEYGGGADHAMRLRAAQAFIERVHGRPQERVNVSNEADPLDVQAMTPEQRAVLLARVLDDHPELAVLIPARTPVVHEAKKTA